jgi:GNAT superfamily N-acetyltransferase
VRPNWAPHLTAAPRAGRGNPGDHPLPGEVLLASGTPAMIWPLLPTDARALREGFRQLSADSRRSRFLTALGDLDDAMLRRLVDGVDGVHHIALVLTVFPPAGHEEPVGVARLVQDPADPATADIAVTVTDRWQGCGVGRALVSALMQRRPAAVSRLHTAVEAGNQASLALLARTGHVSSGPAKLGVLDVTVELTAA